MSKMGSAHSGRETIYSNGSLFFQSVTKNDEGVYTLIMLDQNFDRTLMPVRFSVHPSLLTSWSPPTTAQVTVEAVPPHVAEGKDVLLLVHNLPRALRVFYWYKGTTTDGKNEIVRFITSSNKILLGPEHSGREIIYSNGSLFFQHVTKNDEGVYTLFMLDQNFDRTLTPVRFSVHRYNNNNNNDEFPGHSYGAKFNYRLKKKDQKSLLGFSCLEEKQKRLQIQMPSTAEALSNVELASLTASPDRGTVAMSKV
ncbi:Carcinoembryonic antigen-related cell adhesion molecule 10 [Apodemus speciosus]|uniref:Carcinoembryonic antigen-related cell adhesion molecule 10 n=1 Tax=Apodemus speciosus TaxID=105296 RepID=A0ABQ0EXG4_APOSI